MTTSFSRTQPGPRYRELLGHSQHLHLHGEPALKLAAEKTFNGHSLLAHAERVKRLIDQHGARTLLDYGAGKGQQYGPLAIKSGDGRTYPSIPAWWGVEQLTCYDPGYAPFSQLPSCRFDGVICTDVLEHCHQDDLPWIVGELFGFARKFVFASVACYPAMKNLPNGENAHCTVRPVGWWVELFRLISSRQPAVRFKCCLNEVHRDASGARQMKTSVLVG